MKFKNLNSVYMTHSTRPNFSQPSSRIALVYQSFCSRTIADRLLYDGIAEKNGRVITLPALPKTVKTIEPFPIIYEESISSPYSKLLKMKDVKCSLESKNNGYLC